MRDFSEFKDEKDRPVPLEGKKVKVEDILGIPLIVKAFSRRDDGQYRDGKYYIMQYIMYGKIHVSNTESVVLKRQLDDYEDKLPYTAKIVKIGRYYTFVGVKDESISQSEAGATREDKPRLRRSD